MSLQLLFNLLSSRTQNTTASGIATIPAVSASGLASITVVQTASGSATLAAVTASGNATVTSITVTLSGESAAHTVANGNTATAAIVARNDGTLDKQEGATITQIDSSTDWRIPNGSGAGYYIRFTKGLLTTTPDIGTLDTWLELNVDRSIGYQVTTNDTEHSGTITAEISDESDGSNILDSADFPLSAVVGFPP